MPTPIGNNEDKGQTRRTVEKRTATERYDRVENKLHAAIGLPFQRFFLVLITVSSFLSSYVIPDINRVFPEVKTGNLQRKFSEAPAAVFAELTARS